MADSIGWASSSVLVMTLFAQVWKQWSDNTSKGVSRWLFFGQLCASLGFFAYRVLICSWVFSVVHRLTSIAAGLGMCILWRHAHRRRRSAA